MRTKFLPLVVLGVAGLATTLLFQNCGSKVSFQAPSSNSAALAVINKACVDSAGQSRNDTDQWVVDSISTTAVPCLDSIASTQGYNKQDTYLCSNGEVSKVSSNSLLVPPMSSCPAPNLTAAIISPTTSDVNFHLQVTAATVHDVTYKCLPTAAGTPAASSVLSGILTTGSTDTVLKNVVEDLNCRVQAQYGTAMTLTQDVAVTLDCEAIGQLKNPTTHRCEEFQCKSVVALAQSSAGFYDVPARTTAGICYSVKLMNRIANGSSTLTTVTDPDFLSRDHSAGNGNYLNQVAPYQLGKSTLGFILRQGGGARGVKLSGSTDSLSPILVDNYVAVGLAKTSVGLSDVTSYRAYGTSDSTIDAASTYVKFRTQQLPLKSFGSGGTSTINALDITTRVSTEVPYSLDVRALDCGGARELSDIFLVFQ